jgi:hypothetical protein
VLCEFGGHCLTSVSACGDTPERLGLAEQHHNQTVCKDLLVMPSLQMDLDVQQLGYLFWA